MNEQQTAHKHCIDYTGEWYVTKYFDFELENAFYNDAKLVKSLDNDFIVLSHVVKFQYLGEFIVEIGENGSIKEVSKV